MEEPRTLKTLWAGNHNLSAGESVPRAMCPLEVSMAFVGRWFLTTIATIVAINIVPGIFPVGGPWLGPIACALVLSLINASIKPVLQVIGLPITFLTLGIFALVINACMLELASWLARNILGFGIYIEGFGSAIVGAIIISLVTMLLSAITGIER